MGTSILDQWMAVAEGIDPQAAFYPGEWDVDDEICLTAGNGKHIHVQLGGSPVAPFYAVSVVVTDTDTDYEEEIVRETGMICEAMDALRDAAGICDLPTEHVPVGPQTTS